MCQSGKLWVKLRPRIINKKKTMKDTNLHSLSAISLDKIVKKIPNLYACRLDIKYDNDKDFSKGKKFIVLEVNGVMGHDLAFYDNNNLFKYLKINHIIIQSKSYYYIIIQKKCFHTVKIMPLQPDGVKL